MNIVPVYGGEPSPCPIFPGECEECDQCARIGFCECHDCFICGRVDCEGHAT